MSQMLRLPAWLASSRKKYFTPSSSVRTRRESRRASVRMRAVSEPALGSVSAKAEIMRDAISRRKNSWACRRSGISASSAAARSDQPSSAARAFSRPLAKPSRSPLIPAMPALPHADWNLPNTTFLRMRLLPSLPRTSLSRAMYALFSASKSGRSIIAKIPFTPSAIHSTSSVSSSAARRSRSAAITSSRPSSMGVVPML